MQHASQRRGDHGRDATIPSSSVAVRLVRPGEGAAVVEVAESTRAAGGWAQVSPLRQVLDRVGGRIAIPDVPGATGWCFAAVTDGELVGMLYACTPVDAIQTCGRGHRDRLIGTVVEIEIVAVAEHTQGQGVGTALLRGAEEYLRDLGVQLITAKINASDMPVLRWWRHRSYTLARTGEPCFLDDHGHVGLDDGHDGGWRLAVRAPERTFRRQLTGLWVTPALLTE